MAGKRSVAAAPAAAGIGGVVAALALALGSVAAASGQAPPPPQGGTRLAFWPGMTELTVSGVVSVDGKDRYEVDVSAGQLLMVHLGSATDTVKLSVTEESTGTEVPGTGQGPHDFQALIQSSGTYGIDVMAGRTSGAGQGANGGAYVLDVEEPAAIRFVPGGVAAVRSGPTPQGLPVDYLLDARAGQTLLLDLSSHGGEASLSVTSPMSGDTLIETKPSRHGQVAVRLPQSTSYLISVHPSSGDVAYTLDVVVPAITLPANPVYAGFPAVGRIVVVAQEGLGEGKPKTVLSSRDNGATWRTAVSRPDSARLGTTAGLPADGTITGVTFRNGEDGFLAIARAGPNGGAPGPFLYATSDGGATWSPVGLPFPKDAMPDSLAGFAPSGPLFMDAVDGSMAVDLLFPNGSARSLTYVTPDGGVTWTLTDPASDTRARQAGPQVKVVPAPVIPDAVSSTSAVAGCLSSEGVTVDPARIGAARQFSGKPIAGWIKQVQSALSMPVTAFDSSIAPDGRRLAITFLTCNNSPSASMPISTIFAVVDGNGNVTYLADENGTAYFDGYTTSNTANLYDLYGWLPDSHALLVDAPAFDYGAGGSCEPRPWISINLDGQPGARFKTVNEVFGANGNADLFYVGPSACVDDPHEVHQVETATGKDTIVYTGSDQDVMILDGVSTRAGGKIELRYHLPGGDAQTVVVP